MARIFIVGSGVVGAATGKGLLRAEHEVTFIDTAPRRLDHLRSQDLDARDVLDLRAERSAFVFLTLPTPSTGRGYDLSAFEDGTAAVGRALAGATEPHVVVVRSTVPPGTAEGVAQPLLEKHSGRVHGEDFTLASNPEFLRAASAVEDFRHPWMTVIASRSARTRERLAALLAPFGGETRFFANPAQAEFVKCAHNLFNATKISFWNEMWLVSRSLGLDLDPVAQTVARSAEASYNPDYGIRGGSPYGGVCLPKDTRGFLGLAETIGVDMPLLEAVVKVNDVLAEESGTGAPSGDGDRIPSGAGGGPQGGAENGGQTGAGSDVLTVGAA
ncbi:2-dehydropantoate 2-reductase N-terminal domain-containing protein [Streptomyces sp. NPDC059785]|uniref:2-dehydropantoate 2-reductase N-terminal domain-containing protein n=1 Tax=Streptomyces sp. NPDC059785 TaxID=3346945 RepID=UPI0036600B4C